MRMTTLLMFAAGYYLGRRMSPEEIAGSVRSMLDQNRAGDIGPGTRQPTAGPTLEWPDAGFAP